MPASHDWVSFRSLWNDESTRLTRNDGVEVWYGRCDLCSDEGMRQGATRRGRWPDGSEVPKTAYGCSVCKVYICKACKENGTWDTYGHPGDCSGVGINLFD